MHLDQSRPARHGSGEVVADSVLGVERRAVHGVRHARGELGRPSVEPLGHSGLVGIRQGRHRTKPQPTQRREAGCLVVLVADRPRHAVPRLGVVEVAPHLREHGLGQEVHVHVGEPREPDRRQVRRHLGVGRRSTRSRRGHLPIVGATPCTSVVRDQSLR